MQHIDIIVMQLKERLQFSIIIYHCIRSQNGTFLSFTIVTFEDLKMKIYINASMINRMQYTVKNAVSFIKKAVKNVRKTIH